MSDPVSGRADAIFQTGLDDLVSQSAAILVGPISRYEKIIRSQTPVAGSTEIIPLKWEVRGELNQFEILKGEASSKPIPVARTEQSIMLMPDPSTPFWEADLGAIAANGRIVLFFDTEQAINPFKVLPGGEGDMAIVDVIRSIINIQGIEELDQQLQAWSRYLFSASNELGRQIAVRNLVNSEMKWEQLKDILLSVFDESKTSSQLRLYTFGNIIFDIKEAHRAGMVDQQVEFLGQIFQRASDQQNVVLYLEQFGALLDYTYDEDFLEQRRPLRDRIIIFLKERPSVVLPGQKPLDRELERDYLEIRHEFLSEASKQ
jgi:hypothetical protein